MRVPLLGRADVRNLCLSLVGSRLQVAGWKGAPRSLNHSLVLVGFIDHLDFCSLLSGYYVPGTVLNALQVLSYLIFTTTQWDKCYCCSHMTDGKTEVQRG